MRQPTVKMFDTLSYAKKLKQAGFTEQQAEVQAETFLTIVEDHLVTKRDLKELEVSLKLDMEKSKVELKRDMEKLKIELKRDMGELKKDTEIMRRDMKIWLGSLLATGIATLGALVTIVTTLTR